MGQKDRHRNRSFDFKLIATLVYTLFLFSGIFKSILTYLNKEMPFDITFLFAVILIFLMVIRILLDKLTLKITFREALAIVLLGGFYFFLLLSLLYTPSTNYSYFKSYVFLTNILAFIFPIVCKSFSFKMFFYCFMVGVLLISLWFLPVLYFDYLKNNDYEAFRQIRGLYLTLSYLLGILSITLITDKFGLIENIYIKNIIMVFSVVLMFLMGGRGPILFFILIVGLIYTRRVFIGKINLMIKRRNIMFFPVFFILFLITTGIIINHYSESLIQLFERTISRISLLIPALLGGEDLGYSANTRKEHIIFSGTMIFDSISSFFFGYGIGSYNLFSEGIDGRGYPHNIVLEILFEMGTIGFFIFSNFIVLPIILNRNKIKTVSVFVLLFIFINALKSNSLIDLRVAFSFFAMYLIIPNKY